MNGTGYRQDAGACYLPLTQTQLVLLTRIPGRLDSLLTHYPAVFPEQNYRRMHPRLIGEVFLVLETSGMQVSSGQHGTGDFTDLLQAASA